MQGFEESGERFESTGGGADAGHGEWRFRGDRAGWGSRRE
jgi:hypothetical protein